MALANEHVVLTIYSDISERLLPLRRHVYLSKEVVDQIGLQSDCA